MSDRPRLLVTNDDGIDAPGLAALYEELTAVADVTVVAPTGNKSGVGRTRSNRTTRRDHPWGFALDGTPADCVAYGVAGLDGGFDLVVSGCNHGPNVGNYVVGRSGTVGACIEAAFLGVPGIAVSAYHARDFFLDPPGEYDYGRPARVARELVVRSLAADVFDAVDVLNVNVPVDVPDARMRLTEPHHDYDVDVEHGVGGDEREDGDGPGDGHEDSEDGNVEGGFDGDAPGDVALRDVVWPDTVGWENPFPATDEHRERYPVGTDRRALVEGEVSVSALSAPAVTAQTDALASVVTGFNESEAARERDRAGGA